MKINRLTKEVMISIFTPMLVLGGCILLPIEYAKDCLKNIYWPIEQFAGNRETQRELTIFLFGELTPNYATIQLLLYMLLWSVILFLIIRVGGALNRHLTKK